MDDQERFAAGMKKRRKVLGDAWVDRSIARKNDFNADFLDLITRACWGDVWLRPHFDERTRRIIVISTTIALGRWEEFRLHARAAVVEGGFSTDDLKEIILQQAIYCGVPAANSAMKEAEAMLAEIGERKTKA
jgi:4-carboxymuconolactone decarboxylase